MKLIDIQQRAERELADRSVERVAAGVSLFRASFAMGFVAAIETSGCQGVVTRYRAEVAVALSHTATPVEAEIEPAASAPGDPSRPADLELLLNIARTHRSHERYYTQQLAEGAAQLLRDANALRILADVWMGPDQQIRRQNDPVAGCDDLNAISAIPAIGVLFMEDEGEPKEIAGLKARLRGASAAQQAAGAWLFAKTKVAVERESALLRGTLREAAEARFSTIGVNWCGAQECTLAGRLLALALSRIDSLDLSPAAVRAARRETGQALLEASWLIVMAAQLQAGYSVNLADNDRNWTTCMRVLEKLRSGGSGEVA